MKKIFTVLITIIFTLLLTSCGNSKPKIPEKLDKAVANAIIFDSDLTSIKGECQGEGHIILGTETENSHVKVYALTMLGEYGFENNVFTKVSGSGTVAAVLEFDINDEEYVFNDINYPEDGELNGPSIKKMFPKEYHTRIFKHSNKDYNNLKSQERVYAENYLKSINRKAKILEYGEFKHTFLSEKGIPLKISEKIPGKNFGQYPEWVGKCPDWIGTCERIEDGVRVVYEMDYKENADYVFFRKYDYNSNEELELFKYNARTGEPEN